LESKTLLGVCRWNFDSKAIEILEITQTTIQTAMEELINSEEWGDPLGYSITVNRKGESLETEYSVVPSPAQPTPEGILEAYKAKPINLEALFTDGNPFEEAGISDEEFRRINRVLTVRNVSTILRQSCLVFRLEW
jgi:hypothetical protein